MNCSRTLLFALLLGSLIAAMAIATTRVCASPAELHVGVGYPYATIQAAVTAAASGDSVIVHAGTYVENVNINKPLTLRAASGADPVIDGNHGSCITIAANGVTVSGFELKNGKYGVASWGTDDSVISRNVIHDILNIPSYAGCGIMFWSDSDDFKNNLISDNIIYNNDRQGIYIGGETLGYISSGNTITGNVIYNNGLYTNPNLPDASAYGIQLSYADSNIIRHNDIYGHDDWFANPGFDFAQGIYLFDSNDNHIECNHLHDNNYGVGIWRPSRAAGTNYVNCNNIVGNTGYGVCTFDEPPNVDARSNWWGATTGPTHASNPGGTGDKVSNNVDFTPWLLSTACPAVGGEWVSIDKFRLLSPSIGLASMLVAASVVFAKYRRKLAL